MAQKSLIIMNPASGGGKDAADTDVQDWQRWADSVPDTQLRITQEAGDARRWAAEAVQSDIQRVLAIGGDGTLSEVIGGLRRGRDLEQVGGGDFEPGFTAQDRPVLTLQPAGTGNDFARSLELPHDVEATRQRFLHGRVSTMDLIRVEDSSPAPRWMINVASGGFGRQVADAVDSDTKSRWGVFAYLRVAASKMRESPIYQASLRIDDAEQATTHDCSAILICNGRFVGGGRELLGEDDAAPDDRQFHVAVVTANTFYERLTVGSQFAFHQHLDSEFVQVCAARRLELTCDPEMGFSVDGEPNAQTPLTFVLEPAALRMTVPG